MLLIGHDYKVTGALIYIVICLMASIVCELTWSMPDAAAALNLPASRHQSSYFNEHLGGAFRMGTTFLSACHDAATQLHDQYCLFPMKPVISTHSSVQSPGSHPCSIFSNVFGSSAHHTLQLPNLAERNLSFSSRGYSERSSARTTN